MSDTEVQFGWVKCRNGQLSYDPSPQEIKLQCLEIQAAWSPKERRSRAKWAYSPRLVAVHSASGREIVAAARGA